jgi:tetratricopeptide (TPR) repeat protein
MLESISKWGFNNFRKEDWAKEVKDEHTFPSLVEKAISACIKTCKMHNYTNIPEEFIPFLRTIINNLSDSKQYQRHLGLILFRNGSPDEAVAIYRQLIKQLDDFYVWSELSDMVNDIELQKSALCKALSKEADDSFLGEVHLKLANLLVDIGDYARAKAELEQYCLTYTVKNWKVSNEYKEILSLIPSNIIPTKDNQQFYQDNQYLADEFIYADIQWTPMVLVDIYEKVATNNKKFKRRKIV